MPEVGYFTIHLVLQAGEGPGGGGQPAWQVSIYVYM
jgi:hypothetical protein